jgi:hypothetical protein
LFDRQIDIFFLYVLWASQMQVGEGELHSEKRHPDYRNEPPNPRLKKSKKSKLDSPVVRSPMQIATSPGINMLMRSAALARDSLRVRSASMKRARMAGFHPRHHKILLLLKSFLLVQEQQILMVRFPSCVLILLWLAETLKSCAN